MDGNQKPEEDGPEVWASPPPPYQEARPQSPRPDVRPGTREDDPEWQAYLSGYQQDALMPPAPTWNDILATFNLVARVRLFNPHLAEYLLIRMDLAHRALFNPLVHDFFNTNPNIALCMIQNPGLAHLLWMNPELARVARSDILLNIIAKVDCYLTEHLLRNPSILAMTRNDWLDAVQMPHYDLIEMARENACTCHAQEDRESILDDIDLDDLDSGLNI